MSVFNISFPLIWKATLNSKKLQVCLQNKVNDNVKPCFHSAKKSRLIFAPRVKKSHRCKMAGSLERK